LPRIGWYSLEGKNLENWGIEPDLLVEQEPADRARGVDTQLDRAVAELLTQIGKEKAPAAARATADAESH
jgi:tricorn protease